MFDAASFLTKMPSRHMPKSAHARLAASSEDGHLVTASPIGRDSACGNDALRSLQGRNLPVDRHRCRKDHATPVCRNTRRTSSRAEHIISSTDGQTGKGAEAITPCKTQTPDTFRVVPCLRIAPADTDRARRQDFPDKRYGPAKESIQPRDSLSNPNYRPPHFFTERRFDSRQNLHIVVDGSRARHGGKDHGSDFATSVARAGHAPQAIRWTVAALGDAGTRSKDGQNSNGAGICPCKSVYTPARRRSGKGCAPRYPTIRTHFSFRDERISGQSAWATPSRSGEKYDRTWPTFT
ncbi:hypothetical protein SAMN05192544_102510 [Paraburkholderia hospita]|nr:hypothetical protein SAMN05192544_102510 [Paraburkholderia hospita]